MSPSVFYGFGAFVGSITGSTTCTFWTDDPAVIGFTAPQIPVDLAKNPDAVRRGAITEGDVQADDHASLGTGGQTKIGPMFPGGAMIGAVYLQESYMTSKGLAPPGPRPYEWCTIQYYASEPAPLTSRRFHGFHAQILSVTAGISMVSVWARGTSSIPGQAPMGTWPIDLARWAHPMGPGVTQISAPGQAGALFLDAQAGAAGVIQFDWPKMPKILGGIVVERSRHAR